MPKARSTSSSASQLHLFGAAPEPAHAAGPRTHILSVPFADYRLAKTAGATWDPTLKAHRYHGAALPKPLRGYAAEPYSLEADQERDVNAEPLIEHPGTGALTPYAHQRAAADQILQAFDAGRPGLLLADDVGLGKTVTALLAALAIESVETIIIVCPISVVPHWRETIRTLGDRGRRIIILNYERVKKLFEAPPSKATKRKFRKRTINKRLAAKGTLSLPADLVIIDEAHKCRKPDSQRSKFCAKLAAEAQFTLWLSATAGQNPLELSYLAPVLADVTGSEAHDLRDFEAWCQAQGIGVTRGAYGRWEWDAGSTTAARDLERMRALLFDGEIPAGIRRRPEDIAGWPEITRVVYPVQLSLAERADYNLAWHEFRKAMLLSRTRKDGTSALTAHLRFRQKASLLRAAGTSDLVEELLEQGRQVAVSVTFLESLAAIRTQLEAAGHRVAVCSGAQAPSLNESERRAFQRGEASVVLFTVLEGISLHAGEVLCAGSDTPRATIVHDAKLSAVEAAQVEGRAHRDGKHAPVYYTYGEHTVEHGIIERVVGRLTNMKTMIGDDTATLKEIEAFLVGEIAREDPGPLE